MKAQNKHVKQFKWKVFLGKCSTPYFIRVIVVASVEDGHNMKVSLCMMKNIPHMHLWSAASQQVDESRVEGHDGVAHVNNFSPSLTRPEMQKTHICRTVQT